jgi:hypothetical protein
MVVITLEDAAEDIEAGRQFYESCQEGIGDYFVASILSDVGSLVLYAGIHSLHHGLYRMLSRRFPFAIYYAIEPDAVYVYAILDMRRDPLWIHKILKKRK